MHIFFSCLKNWWSFISLRYQQNVCITIKRRKIDVVFEKYYRPLSYDTGIQIRDWKRSVLSTNSVSGSSNKIVKSRTGIWYEIFFSYFCSIFIISVFLYFFSPLFPFLLQYAPNNNFFKSTYTMNKTYLHYYLHCNILTFQRISTYPATQQPFDS